MYFGVSTSIVKIPTIKKYKGRCKLFMWWRVCQPAQTQISPQTPGEAVVETLLLAGQVHISYCHQHLIEMPALWPKYNSAPCPCWERGTLGPTSTVNHKAIYTLSSPLARYFTFMVNTDRTEVKRPWHAFSEDLQNQGISVLLSLLSPPILHSGLFILSVLPFVDLQVPCSSLDGPGEELRPLEPSVFRTAATGKQQVSRRCSLSKNDFENMGTRNNRQSRTQGKYEKKKRWLRLSWFQSPKSQSQRGHSPSCKHSQ